MERLRKLAQLIRYWSIRATAEAGSGHASSSLSAADLMTTLMFGDFFRFDTKRPDFPNNDRLIFSKGHASPLYYSLWLAAGVINEKKLLQFRKFTDLGADMQGHPTTEFKFAEATTGSLGQGLSIGVGMALNAKYLDKSDSRTFVLLGDSEMAEGSVWEAMSIAAHYKLHNLVAIVDVNRLGQRGETMHGHDTKAYAKKAEAFGWDAIMIDGHDIAQIQAAFKKALASNKRPTMIVGKTLKGKGVPMIEDQDGWHGKIISTADLATALAQLGSVDMKARGSLAKPRPYAKKLAPKIAVSKTVYPKDKLIATRKAYGNALQRIGADQRVVVLDAETSNSTYAELFKHKYPERFFEMFIAEQNMLGVAQGLSRRGKIPFVSTFAAFLTRAFDQIRMGSYSDSNVKICGSHAGVSIGEDGVSQMGLEDIAMLRSVWNSTVVYPSDAIATEALVREIAKHKGISYIRTTRKETPILYGTNEKFPIGGSKVLRRSSKDVATIVAAGITVHEALAAYDQLRAAGVHVRVIDLYSIKPLDEVTLRKAAKETGTIITVEDHYPAGGIGEAVATALSDAGIPCVIKRLAVRKMPRSGTPDQLIDFEDIGAKAIVKAVTSATKSH